MFPERAFCTNCLYELIRDTKASTKFRRALKKASPATASEIERFTVVLTEALSSSGFLDRRTVADADERIRRLVRRLNQRRHVDRHNVPNRLEA